MPLYNNLTYIPWGTFTPTVTLVGGSGNTVPQYITNSGRYTRIGNTVYCSVYLTGDGGNEGAGTGQINIALPIVCGANTSSEYFPVGTTINGTTFFQVVGQVTASGSTISLGRTNAGALSAVSGSDQNNSTRIVRLQFFYEV